MVGQGFIRAARQGCGKRRGAMADPTMLRVPSPLTRHGGLTAACRERAPRPSLVAPRFGWGLGART
jgi:hypothetical protein